MAATPQEVKLLEAELKAARKRAATLGYDINPIVGSRSHHWALEKQNQTPCTTTGRAVFNMIACQDLTVVHTELDTIASIESSRHWRRKVHNEPRLVTDKD
jgi:hypothetical protein